MEEITNLNAAADSKSNRKKKSKKNRSKASPNQLRELFNDYVKFCHTTLRFVNIAGFCVFARISRQTFYNYKNDDKYHLVMDYIENVMEDETLNVNYKQYPIALLYLKNKFGYADKVENKNVNTNIESIISAIDDDDNGLDL